MLGGFGEALFFLCLLAMGGVGLYLMLAGWLVPEWQANRNFVAAECVVLEGRVRTEEMDGNDRFFPELLIEFEADGEVRQEWTYTVTPQYSDDSQDAQQVVDEFEVGQSYSCWYDPAQPERVVLKRGFRWWLWLLVILPASFVVLGAVGLVIAVLQSGASTERRAALSQRAAQLDLFESGPQTRQAFPTIPQRDDITESPGTLLSYRLPADASPRWRYVGMIALCLLWNGISAVTLVWLIRDFVAGEGSWASAAVIVPLAIIGLAILVRLVQRLWRTSRLGMVRIEISAHPLVPGKTYDVALLHSGGAPLRWLSLDLICEEETAYRQGTDIRTAKEKVWENSLYRRENGESSVKEDAEDRCELCIPVDTMHSFKSEHNQVRWDLVVQGEVAGPHPFMRRFPVIVLPPGSAPR